MSDTRPADGAVAESVASGAAEEAFAPDAELRADADADAGTRASTDVNGVGTELSAQLPAGRQIILRGTATVAVDDVGAAVDRLRTLASGAGGYLGETSLQLEEPRPNATVVMRIPPARYDATVRDLGSLGRLVTLSSNASDVTQAVVDLEARIAATEVSVDRLRDFLTRAATVEDLASLERELTTREQTLAEYRAQRRGLADQVSLTTLTVILLRPDVAPTLTPPNPRQWHERIGDRFSDGVDALGTAGAGLLAGIGFLVPFLLVLAPLIAVWIVLRRRRRRRRLRSPSESVETLEGM